MPLGTALQQHAIHHAPQIVHGSKPLCQDIHAPHGVAHGLTQISRQMPQESSSRSAVMQDSLEGVQPCCDPASAPACGDEAGACCDWCCCCSSPTGIFSCSSAAVSSAVVRRCVRGLHSRITAHQISERKFWQYMMMHLCMRAGPACLPLDHLKLKDQQCRKTVLTH